MSVNLVKSDYVNYILVHLYTSKSLVLIEFACIELEIRDSYKIVA